MTSGKPHIFIVDDDLSFGKSLARLLRVRGYHAEAFSSAVTFLDSVSPDQRGVVVLDLHMPGCDGFNLFEKMKEHHFLMPVIFTTGQAHADERCLALHKGALGFLIKPFREESLLELLAGDEPR